MGCVFVGVISTESWAYSRCVSSRRDLIVCTCFQALIEHDKRGSIESFILTNYIS